MTAKILIVEPDRAQAEDIEQRLKLLGFDPCGRCLSSDEALADIERKRPELILLDIDQIDPDRFSRVIDEINRRHRCAIIFTTTTPESSSSQTSGEDNPGIFLEKPIRDNAELARAVQLALKKHEPDRISYLLQTPGRHPADSVELLPHSEILFKTIFDHTPVGIALVSVNDDFLMANSKFCDFLGYDKTELTHMTAPDIIHPADLNACAGEEVLKRNTPSTVSCEKRFLRKDGQFVLGHMSQTSIADETGNTIFYLWQVEDLTDRKRVEHERLKLESIVEHSPDIIAMITMSGHFRYINPTGVRLLGVNQSPNELAVSDITDRTARGDTLADLCENVRQHGLWKCELLLRKLSDGTSIPVAANAFILNSPTSTSQPTIALIAKDLTEAKKREEERQALQDQLVRAEKMHSLGLLAGGVAHDLNNILGPLVAYPDLVLRKLPADSPLRQQVERMRDSACSAANVVQDLLTLARRGRHEQLPVNLNQVVEGFVESPLMEKMKAESPDINVDIHLSDAQPVVLGAATQLEKIIMNLVVNSFDAINGPGTITVATGVRELDELSTGYSGFAGGSYAYLCVKDTGVGIAEDQVKKIFEPYYSTKNLRGRSGTGLGLAIVYGILKDHNGYYDLITQPGQGTEFVIYIPSAVSETVHDKSALNLCGTERLLVVDDDEQQRGVARECLESYGYVIETASSGREALEIFQNENFDLILLDMVMEEDFDGLDTYRAMKQIDPDVRAIIVSGSAATERVKGAIRLGAGGYVQKPYTAEHLAKTVRGEIDREDDKPKTPANVL